MKKIIFLFSILLSISCSTAKNEIIEVVIEEEVVITPKKVEIILTTSQPDLDEITVSYYDFDISDWVFGPMPFEYDSNGNSEPIILSFPDYIHKTIEGNAYRKNNSPSSLKAQIYIDDILVYEEETFGTDLVYAQVFFDYTIEE